MIGLRTPRFQHFIAALEAFAVRPPDSAVAAVKTALGVLIADDRWLPAAYRSADTRRYRQYLLARAPDASFSVVSFVWGPGQSTPVHDHGVWGLVGVLEGAEIEQRYRRQGGQLEPLGSARRIEAGEVAAISPGQDIHQVRNAFIDRVSISIHVYGGDIGRIRRAVYDPAGTVQPFISGYDEIPS